MLGAAAAARSLLALHKPIAPDLAGRIALLMAAAFGVCFGLLELCRAIYKRRRERLDDVEESGR